METGTSGVESTVELRPIMRLETFLAVGVGLEEGAAGMAGAFISMGEEKESLPISIVSASAAVGTSWSDAESRLKMSVHFVDFLDLSSGVERAVLAALTAGVAGVKVTTAIGTGRSCWVGV
jgi:hypothetical protein